MINDSLFLEVFNASEDAILIIDGGSFVDCNQATLRMLHCNSKGKLLPAPPWELSPPFQPDGRPSEEKAEEMIRIARERNFHRFEWVHVRADGEEFPAEVTLTPIHLNGKNMLYVVWRDLTEQKRIEQNLRQSEERFRNVARVTTDVIWDWDLQSDTRWWSDGIQRHFGYSPEELERDSRSWTARIHAEDRPRVLVGIQAIINGKVTEWNDEYRFVCKDDSVAEVADNGIIIRDQSGQPVRMVGGMTNVTEQRHYEQQLRQAVHVLASTREGVTITDAQKCILSINQAFTDITGYTEKEVRGKTPGILSSGLHDDKFYKAMWRSITKTGRWQGEIWNRRKSGEIYPEWLTISAVHDKHGNIVNYVGVFSDISHIKQSEKELEQLKSYDPLTGLPNRMLLMVLLRQAIKRAERQQSIVVLLFCDIDGYKQINDNFSYAVGDEVLKIMAERFQRRLRSEDVLARLGADEYVVLIESPTDPQAGARLAQDLIRVADKPIRLSSGTEIAVGLSVGIAVFPTDVGDAESLLQCADIAMNQAKLDKKEHYSFYTPAMTEFSFERMRLESELRHALKTGQLTVYFQPLLTVADESIVGAEALVRWLHPEWGMVPPDQFIPLAEETGLIEQISEQVLHRACTKAAAWRTAGCGHFRLMVNISAKEIIDQSILHRIKAVLADTGLEPAALEIELTEWVFMDRSEQTKSLLHELAALHVRLAIDDFGTGYSSLAYLQDIAADTLKIDRRFINNIIDNTRSKQIASAVITMGHSIGMEVVAEGVETRAQLEWIQERGCDLFQGYLVSPAVPADDFERLLLGHSTDEDR